MPIRYKFYKLLRFLHLISKNKYKKRTARYRFMQSPDYQLIARSKLFDAKWYLTHNPDVKQAGLDPVEHYLKFGWQEDRDCTPYFDGKQYLQMYPDVAACRLNPLLHWEKYGKNEGRKLEEEKLQSKLKIFNVNTYRDKLVSYKHKIDIIEAINQNEEMPQLRILYITTTSQTNRPIKDASSRYRCYHPAETLKNYKKCLVSIVSHAYFIHHPSSEYDVYIFHRPCLNEISLIRRLKEKNKILIADYDDLIFGNSEIAKVSSIYKNRVKPLADCIEIFANNLKALLEFDNFTVSTEYLAQEVQKQKASANVQVVHNFIPDSIFRLAKLQNLSKAKKDNNLIIYCCGTLSHNKDFAVIEKVLLDCLRQDSSLKLLIIGPLSCSSELNDQPQVFFHSVIDYWKLFSFMKNACLAIAPLENSIFNKCKSNVKFLEAGVAGVSLIATPIPDMQRVGHSNIILAENASDWKTAILNRKNINFSKNSAANFGYIQQHCASQTFLSEFHNLFLKMGK